MGYQLEFKVSVRNYLTINFIVALAHMLEVMRHLEKGRFDRRESYLTTLMT